MKDSTQPSANKARGSRERVATAFGGFSGGAIGWAISYGLYLVIGRGYPVTPITFALIVVCAVAGMTIAEALGTRAFRILGMVSGAILAGLITLLLFLLMNASRT